MGIPDWPEHDGYARLGGPGFGYRVLPSSLAAAAHDEQVAPTQVESERAAWLGGVHVWVRAQHKAARCTDGHGGDERVGQLTRDAITVECDTVTAVSIQCKRDTLELVIVPCVEGLLHRRDDGWQRTFGECRDQPWRCDFTIEQVLLGVLPGRLAHKRFEQRVVITEPALCIVEPGAELERGALDASEGCIKSTVRWF